MRFNGVAMENLNFQSVTKLSILIWDSTVAGALKTKGATNFFQFSFEIQLQPVSALAFHEWYQYFQFSFEIQQMSNEVESEVEALNFQFSFEIQRSGECDGAWENELLLSILIWDSTDYEVS